MKAFLYILLIISVLSCSTAKQNSDITRFVCKNCAESPSSVAPIPKTVTIVPLETTSEVLLHNIESLQIADTLIFLYDGRALYSFGLNGKFIVKI
ncbi:MAG: 6-bladed beta-propeller, partial [Candidatus Symbiothrix sp.]|nr:6-bladed beta-propeller [Candidatus Symbiothrix sp.]